MSEDESHERYEGYSDYRSVSNRMALTVADAVDAYAALQSLHSENARVRPQLAAELKRDILAAALNLLPDVQANAAEDDGDEPNVFNEILERWEDEDGALDRLHEASFQHEVPEWLRQLATDIRVAGREVGYLKAGRTVTDSELDPVDQEARDMFE